MGNILQSLPPFFIHWVSALLMIVFVVWMVHICLDHHIVLVLAKLSRQIFLTIFCMVRSLPIQVQMWIGLHKLLLRILNQIGIFCLRDCHCEIGLNQLIMAHFSRFSHVDLNSRTHLTRLQILPFFTIAFLVEYVKLIYGDLRLLRTFKAIDVLGYRGHSILEGYFSKLICRRFLFKSKFLLLLIVSFHRIVPKFKRFWSFVHVLLVRNLFLNFDTFQGWINYRWDILDAIQSTQIHILSSFQDWSHFLVTVLYVCNSPVSSFSQTILHLVDIFYKIWPTFLLEHWSLFLSNLLP